MFIGGEMLEAAEVLEGVDDRLGFSGMFAEEIPLVPVGCSSPVVCPISVPMRWSLLSDCPMFCSSLAKECKTVRSLLDALGSDGP